MIEPQGTPAREAQASPTTPSSAPSAPIRHPDIILAGVAGSGKTTLGRLIAQALGFVFLDADDLHTPEAKTKMNRGMPLTDADRQPWLNSIKVALSEPRTQPLILACSALKRAFRQQLAEGLQPPPIWFWLDAPQAEIRQRLKSRLAQGEGHFFAPELADSQFSAAEADPNHDLDLHFISTAPSPDQVLAAILAVLRRF